MAKYIMANRRAGMFSNKEKLDSRKALQDTFTTLAKKSNVVNDRSGPNETSRRVIVLDIDPNEVEKVRDDMHPEVMIEPEILHYPQVAMPLDLIRLKQQSRSQKNQAGVGKDYRFQVTGSGTPLNGVEVSLYLRSPTRSHIIKGLTDANGEVVLTASSFWQAAAAVISPVGGFWPHVLRGPNINEHVRLTRLPNTGYTAWWHRLHGVNRYDAGRGHQINVGVCDTGLGPHPNVSHVSDQGSFINGAYNQHGGADVDSHGTHVVGIIGAIPRGTGEVSGLSPGANLYSARVFPAGQGANQGDIANAIDHLSINNECDLINLSLGSVHGSGIEHDAIKDAFERGTVCVCAAGNDGVEPVSYPAAFPETIAISALGLSGWAHDGSLSALSYPNNPDKYGFDGYYLADFSSFGQAISAIGGGVGIISTVPGRHGYTNPYAVMDGTSMASPAVCASIAAMLSQDADYLSMPRDVLKSEQAHKLMRAHAKDIGLTAIYQGYGAPQAT